MRVVIADDHELARAGLRAIVETDPTLELVAEVSSLDVVAGAIVHCQAAVVVLDLRWQGDDLTALALIDSLRHARPGLRVVAITAYDLLLAEGRRRGADACLLKNFSAGQLLHAIHGSSLVSDATAVVAGYTRRLQAIPSGSVGARDYERLMGDVLPFSFGTALTDFERQRRHAGGREVWDVVALNTSEHPFWSAIRHQHGALQVVIELKNVDCLRIEHVLQLANYLTPPIGRFGVLISREIPAPTLFARMAALLRERGTAIVALGDADIEDAMQLVAANGDPSIVVKRAYLTLTRH